MIEERGAVEVPRKAPKVVCIHEDATVMQWSDDVTVLYCPDCGIKRPA